MKVYYRINELDKRILDIIKVDFCCKDIEESLAKGYIHGELNKIYLKDKIIRFCPFCGKGIIFIEKRINDKGRL